MNTSLPKDPEYKRVEELQVKIYTRLILIKNIIY